MIYSTTKPSFWETLRSIMPSYIRQFNMCFSKKDSSRPCEGRRVTDPGQRKYIDSPPPNITIGVGGGGGGGRGHCAPQKKLENEKFGQKQWEIRAKAIGNSGKSNEKYRGKKNNRKFGQKQCENQAKAIMPKIYAAAFRVFSLPCPNFSIAFARISYSICPNFLLLLPKSSIAFARIFRIAFGMPEFAIAFARIWAKAMRKHEKRRDIGVFRAEIMEVLSNNISRIDTLFSKFTS